MKAINNRESRSYTCPKSPANIVRKNVGTVKIKEIITCKPILFAFSKDSSLYFLGSTYSSEPNPPLLIASLTAPKSSFAPSDHLIVAFSRGRLTLTESIPSKLLTMDSTDATQDAQVIPVTRRFNSSMI